MNPNDVTNPFIRAHLAYTANTEPPVRMQIWAAIAAAAACMGRHAWLDTGIDKLFANNYILLVGPPGTRKSTAAKLVTRIVKRSTHIRTAPDDTGGQRQGLLTAMTDSEDMLGNLPTTRTDASMIDLAALGQVTVNMPNPADRHVLFAHAPEFGSFVGQNNMDMIRFLIRMWDGEDTYRYKLSRNAMELTNPLMTVLGCTTSTDMAMLFPPEAIGQGFMSRMLLVQANQKRSDVPRPSLDKSQLPLLEETFAYLANDLAGGLIETAEAARLLDAIYVTKRPLKDNRFIFYEERRHTHLCKTALTLAACRRSMSIEIEDIELAQTLLQDIEEHMPDALGEYGMSPVALSRQRIMEFIQHAGQPVHERVLWAMMQREMRAMEFKGVMADLISADKIKSHKTPTGLIFMLNDDLANVVQLMSENKEPQFIEEKSRVIQTGTTDLLIQALGDKSQWTN